MSKIFFKVGGKERDNDKDTDKEKQVSEEKTFAEAQEASVVASADEAVQIALSPVTNSHRGKRAQTLNRRRASIKRKLSNTLNRTLKGRFLRRLTGFHRSSTRGLRRNRSKHGSSSFYSTIQTRNTPAHMQVFL